MGIIINTKTGGVVTTKDLLENIEERRLELHELRHELKHKMERALELANEIDTLYYTLKKFVPEDINVFTATFSEEKGCFAKVAETKEETHD